MNEITTRLKEAREIETAREILESAGYTIKPLNEAWPPVLNKLGKYEKSQIRSKLLQKGYDIENFPSDEIQLTSGRDTRIKSGMTIVDFGRNHIAVWVNGDIVVDAYPPNYDDRASELSWKKILERDPETYYMAFDAEGSASMKQKQSDRKASQRDTVNRYTRDTKPRHAKIDKSGYIVDPKKYENMLSAMKLDSAKQILQDAKDLYVKLANNLDKVDFDKDTGYKDYDYVMRNLLNGFKSLNKSLREYNNSQNQDMDDADAKDWYIKYHRSDVIQSIKDIRAAMKDAKSYEDLDSAE